VIAYLTVFGQFVLRAMLREKLRTAVTVLGISLGVGVAIAIRLANTGALHSFRAATESVAGETSIQITGSAGRFDEMLLADLGWLREYGQVSPVISGFAILDRSSESSVETDRGAYSKRGPALQVLGVDVLRDRTIRRYRLIRTHENGTEPSARELLALLADPRSVVLTEQLARRQQISIGNRIALLIGDTRREFVVRGLLLDEGPARALQGNFALLDIAAAQLAFDRLGLLDRVDIKLKPGLDVNAIENELQKRLPSGLSVVKPEAGYDQVEKMISAFQFNLSALGSIAILVGLFLIYNTVSISVISRRDEIGALRAVGANRNLVLAFFAGEAVLLTLVGTVIGLGLGVLMARAAVQVTATTVQTFYVAAAATDSVTRSTLGSGEVGLAFLVALPLSLVSAAVPALEASRVRPIEAIRGAQRLSRTFKPSKQHLIISLLLFVLGYLFSEQAPINGLPLFGYLAALSFMFGGAFLVPNVLWLACWVFGKWRLPTIGRIGRILNGVALTLASANLRAAIQRVSISIAALAVALGMMVAISIMVGSFRDTVSYWVGETMVADIYARPVTRTSATDEGEISDDAIAAVRSDPQVAAVYPFTTQELSYQGEPIVVGSGDFETFLRYGRLLYKSPANAADKIREAIGQDAVAVNESFSLRFKKVVGDVIDLPTVNGQREFRIIAIYYDYSSSRGWAVMDKNSYARYFPYSRPSSMSIYLRNGADANEVSDRLSEAVNAKSKVVFATNGVLRREVMRIFDSTFAITYALEVIAIVVAALGVISTLITLILERRGEIAMLGFLGATRAQIRAMVVIEALIIGAVSQIVGIIIGYLLSLVLIYVINVQSFGWTIQFHVPIAFLAQSTPLILIVSAIAGLYPAGRATSIGALRFAREE
jgi:putative ABC transport system permease protein